MTDIPPHYGYDQDGRSALDAISEAQRIAFGPMLFQAAVNLRDQGILAFLDQRTTEGATLDEISRACSLSAYATELLLDMGLSMKLLCLKDAHYHLASTGHFLLHDTMTRVNMDFVRDVCYAGMDSLGESLQEARPAGLTALGHQDNIYPVLDSLPEAAKNSWFAFDHFYSDSAFGEALPHVFALRPALIYDVGGNTGRWALRCCEYDPDVHITLLDLPEQLQMADATIREHGLSGRVSGHPTNILKDEPLPGDADVWWMSQFLDCFSEEEIIRILRRIHDAAREDARLCILDLLWNRQPFEAGALCLNASSLYFTAIANGCSRFYSAESLRRCIEAAGFSIERHIDQLGIGHSLLICRKAQKEAG